jgi:hypothetical protein
MAKFYISGDITHDCRIEIFTTADENYLGYLDVNAGAYEVVFELDSLENVNVWCKRSDGYSLAYGNVTPLDGSAKEVNITYEFTFIYGGNAATY